MRDATSSSPGGLIGVRGPNGAGKSTLAEAIAWALFGQLRPGSKIGDARRQGAQGQSSVEMTFRLGPTVYRIHRVVGGRAALWIGDADEPETTQTRATNVAVARELGIGWDSFQRTVFARQKDVAALDPSATKAARTAHVERLLGLKRYREAATASKARAKTLADQLTGMREEAPDLIALRGQLQLALDAAASGSPAVIEAEQLVQKARTHAAAAQTAVADEQERVSTAGRHLRSTHRPAPGAQGDRRRSVRPPGSCRNLSRTAGTARCAPAGRSRSCLST